MRVVDKGFAYGRPDTDWVTGSKVGDPHLAVTFDRTIDFQTPEGPLYFVQPTVETMGRLFGMLTKPEADELHAEIAALKAELLEERQLRFAAELDLENFKGILERRYNVATVTPEYASAIVMQTEAGPVKTKAGKK